MSFDIYGERLAAGHCEVHPWVHCEYPCPVCDAEYEYRRREKDEWNQGMRAQEDAFHAQMAGDAEYESWFPS